MSEDNNDDNYEEHADHTLPVFFLFFMVLLASVLLLGRALHNRPKLNSLLSEPAMVLIVSAFVSFLIRVFFPAEEYALGEEFNGYSEYNDNGDDGDGGENNSGNNYVGVDQNQLSQFLLTFSGEVFFMVFLPPIMFNSGYELKRELFFRHLKPIVSFAVVGTAVSGILTGVILWGVTLLGWTGQVDANLLELLTFGSLITATDTVSVLGVLNAKKVNPHLFSLVFGESALNDAVAIVLFQSFSHMMRMGGISDKESLLDELAHFAMKFSLDALGCPVMGMVFSFLAALVFKHVEFQGTPVLELSLYLLIMYIPFIFAEVLGMSGIVTIFFSGIFARRYIEPNVSDETKHNAEVIFNLVAYLAETCIFINLGLSVFGFSGRFDWAFIIFAFLASLIGRAMSVYPISFLFNRSLVERTTEGGPISRERRPTIDVVTSNDIEEDIMIAMSALDSMRTMKNNDDNKNVANDDANRIAADNSKDGIGFFSADYSFDANGNEIIQRTPERSLDKVIPSKFMHFLWFAGLRGAVAYACARDFPDVFGNKNEVIAATIVIVFFSVIVMGACCELLLYKLDIRMGVDNDEYMREWRNRRRLNGPLHRIEKQFVYDVVVRGPSRDDDNSIELPDKPFHLTSADGSLARSMSFGRSMSFERATTASTTARTLMSA